MLVVLLIVEVNYYYVLVPPPASQPSHQPFRSGRRDQWMLFHTLFTFIFICTMYDIDSLRCCLAHVCIYQNHRVLDHVLRYTALSRRAGVVTPCVSLNVLAVDNWCFRRSRRRAWKFFCAEQALRLLKQPEPQTRSFWKDEGHATWNEVICHVLLYRGFALILNLVTSCDTSQHMLLSFDTWPQPQQLEESVEIVFLGCPVVLASPRYWGRLYNVIAHNLMLFMCCHQWHSSKFKITLEGSSY